MLKLAIAEQNYGSGLWEDSIINTQGASANEVRLSEYHLWVSLFDGMEWWNGTMEWNSGMKWWNGTVE